MFHANSMEYFACYSFVINRPTASKPNICLTLLFYGIGDILSLSSFLACNSRSAWRPLEANSHECCCLWTSHVCRLLQGILGTGARLHHRLSSETLSGLHTAVLCRSQSAVCLSHCFACLSVSMSVCLSLSLILCDIIPFLISGLCQILKVSKTCATRALKFRAGFLLHNPLSVLCCCTA